MSSVFHHLAQLERDIDAELRRLSRTYRVTLLVLGAIGLAWLGVLTFVIWYAVTTR